MPDDTSLGTYFRRAKLCVDVNGYRPEYEYQRSIIGKPWSETDFLREYSWVVFSCGFREHVVRKWFSYISMVFFDFVSARKILRHRKECVELALSAINNAPKIDGIIETAIEIDRLGFEEFRANIYQDSTSYLKKLPYIGDITCCHLLKNLGFNVSKNDRHLKRISTQFEFAEGTAFCEHIAELTGEPVAVVDIILWRYAVIASQASSDRAVDNQ